MRSPARLHPLRMTDSALRKAVRQRLLLLDPAQTSYSYSQLRQFHLEAVEAFDELTKRGEQLSLLPPAS